MAGKVGVEAFGSCGIELGHVPVGLGRPMTFVPGAVAILGRIEMPSEEAIATEADVRGGRKSASHEIMAAVAADLAAIAGGAGDGEDIVAEQDIAGPALPLRRDH